MGIQDRDYMKRPADDDAQGGSSSDSRAEEFARKFLRKPARVVLYAGIGAGILMLAAWVVGKFFPVGH